jgi:membrane-bound lytic murein transglycosylase A
VLVLPDGARRTIGFAASNGHPYVSIGKLLVDRRELALEQASMDGIRGWIARHPEEGTRLLQENPRYVFFRDLDGPPLGSLGVPVTAGRTIATDPAVFPPGALGFLRVPALGPSVGLARSSSTRTRAPPFAARVALTFSSGPGTTRPRPRDDYALQASSTFSPPASRRARDNFAVDAGR